MKFLLEMARFGEVGLNKRIHNFYPSWGRSPHSVCGSVTGFMVQYTHMPNPSALLVGTVLF